jgi:hypothetical protein
MIKLDKLAQHIEIIYTMQSRELGAYGQFHKTFSGIIYTAISILLLDLTHVTLLGM